MALSQKAYEGELFIDHRASPGLPAAIAHNRGFDPQQVGEGKLFEAATRTCSHCQTRVVLNPLRQRERATCLHCASHYICDLCDAERRRPDYVHRSFRDVIDMVCSGKYAIAPGSTSVRPLLVPTKELIDG